MCVHGSIGHYSGKKGGTIRSDRAAERGRRLRSLPGVPRVSAVDSHVRHEVPATDAQPLVVGIRGLLDGTLSPRASRRDVRDRMRTKQVAPGNTTSKELLLAMERDK